MASWGSCEIYNTIMYCTIHYSVWPAMKVKYNSDGLWCTIPTTLTVVHHSYHVDCGTPFVPRWLWYTILTTLTVVHHSYHVDCGTPFLPRWLYGHFGRVVHYACSTEGTVLQEFPEILEELFLVTYSIGSWRNGCMEIIPSCNFKRIKCVELFLVEKL